MNNEKYFCSYVNGKWIQSEDRIDFEIRDPGNLNQISSRYRLATKNDVDLAVKAAKDSFYLWSDLPASKRAEYIYDLIDLWKSQIDEIASITTMEMGKPIRESRLEAIRAVNEMRFWAGEALRLGDRTFSSTRKLTEAYVIRQPIGPIAAITPWNFPILTPIRKIVPALICGCTVVLKPSIQSPGSSVILGHLLERAGLPSGVFNLIVGMGKDVGDALITNNDIKGITFTGSTKVGMHISAVAAQRNAKTQLEMGGKNAAVVASCSDIDYAAKEIVSAAFTTSGQRCTAVSRVIVLEDQKKQLEEKIVNYAKALRVGYGLDETTEMGPLSSKEQYDIVSSYIQLAEQGEGRIIGKGSIGLEDGYYIPPIIVTDVRPSSRLAIEEIFGPILVIISAKDFDEALKINNETNYGLTSAIFTDNMNYAYKFAIKSETGMVHVNHGTSSEGHLPFGGVKLSGQGAFGIGDTSKDFFTTLKVVYRMYK